MPMPMPASPRHIHIADYTYELPDDRIARHPAPVRDQSRLLLYRGGALSDTVFAELADHLPPGALLVFNDTRVIHARLRFALPQGGHIEVFCLDPLHPVEHQQSLSATGEVVWKCLVGHNRRWKSGQLTTVLATPAGPCTLHLERQARMDDAFAICFRWEHADLTFADLLAAAGTVPLPPYLGRDTDPDDEARYQTVYAAHEGSVAAPTAGLHFTPAVFEALEQRGVERLFVTLHVGAGTFKPVKSEQLGGHPMHEEKVHLGWDSLVALAEAKAAGRPIVAVGTTAARVLESLYWYGCGLQADGPPPPLWVGQWDPYEGTPQACTPAEALRRLTDAMQAAGQTDLTGATQILIAPPYRFRVVDGLITNFHQPQSTLLLLIAALIGEEWRRVYDHALGRGFRFLSYGDSSLLMPYGNAPL